MSWLSITNLKLFQSQLLLQQWQPEQPPVLQQAIINAALYHVSDAYVAYLHELAEAVAYRQTVLSLDDLMAHVSLITGEMKELQVLEQDGYSWLAQCLQAISECRRPTASSQVVQVREPSLIPVVNDPTSDVVQWQQRLSDLIDMQRANRHES